MTILYDELQESLSLTKANIRSVFAEEESFHDKLLDSLNVHSLLICLFNEHVSDQKAMYEQAKGGKYGLNLQVRLITRIFTATHKFAAYAYVLQVRLRQASQLVRDIINDKIEKTEAKARLTDLLQLTTLTTETVTKLEAYFASLKQ